MIVWSLQDIERAYHKARLPRTMLDSFLEVLFGYAKHTRSTGKRSQLNHFKGHVRQLAAKGELGYQARELEWIVLCEAMARGYPTQKVMLKNGDIIDVPKDPHREVEPKDFGLLIDILHEIAYDNDVVLTEYNDERTTEDPAPQREVQATRS